MMLPLPFSKIIIDSVSVISYFFLRYFIYFTTHGMIISAFSLLSLYLCVYYFFLLALIFNNQFAITSFVNKLIRIDSIIEHDQMNNKYNKMKGFIMHNMRVRVLLLVVFVGEREDPKLPVK